MHDVTIPDNPLGADELPMGGLAHAVVAALADHAAGKMLPACSKNL